MPTGQCAYATKKGKKKLENAVINFQKLMGVEEHVIQVQLVLNLAVRTSTE